MAKAERQSVVIAGGGVAGLEALLALDELAGDRVAVELLAPDPEFHYRPLQVAEAFGLAAAQRIDLERACSEHGARFTLDALTAVDPGARTLATRGGKTVEFDALLIAIGTSFENLVPGSLAFGSADERRAFPALLERIEHHEVTRIAFAIPGGVWWTLPAYELALLTAAHLRAWDASPPAITIVSHESRPFASFGAGASEAVSEVLAEARIEFAGGGAPVRFAEGILELAGGESTTFDAVVSLPGHVVPKLKGIPQRAGGFIPTDVAMNVEGTTSIWAAGDATWLPIKQGGMAAQQADVAAAAIAARAGAHSGGETFRGTLRGALLTGALPLYLRSRAGGGVKPAEVARDALWQPRGKIAARRLGPYAARLAGDELDRFSDVAAAESTEALDEAFHFALAAADADARHDDYEGALEWLEAAEHIGLTLPPGYAERRRAWAAAASASSQPGPAAPP